MYVVLCSPDLEFYVSEPNSLWVYISFSQSRSFEKNVRNLVVPHGRVCYFTLVLPQLKPKLKGYVYDNIVGCLRVEFSSDFVQPARPAWTASRSKTFFKYV